MLNNIWQKEGQVCFSVMIENEQGMAHCTFSHCKFLIIFFVTEWSQLTSLPLRGGKLNLGNSVLFVVVANWCVSFVTAFQDGYLLKRRRRWWKWWNWVNWILATLWSNYWVIRVPWLAAALFCFFCLSRSPTLAPEIGAIVIHSTQNWRRFSYLYALGQKSRTRTKSNCLVLFFIISTMLLQYLGMEGFKQFWSQP